MTTRTPGPWKTATFDKAQEPYGAVVYYEPDNDGAVDIAHLIVEGRAPWAMQADARLIAAAPDLLAALQAAEERLVQQQCNGTTFEEVADTLDAVRAAIAKAEGKP